MCIRDRPKCPPAFGPSMTRRSGILLYLSLIHIFGILAGANVVMPNMSPTGVRKDYALYDNKICTGDEAAECRRCLERRMESIGYRVVTARGDSLNL